MWDWLRRDGLYWALYWPLWHLVWLRRGLHHPLGLLVALCAALWLLAGVVQ